MKSFKLKKKEPSNKKIYLAGGIKTPFEKPVFHHVVFFKINKPKKYTPKQLFFKKQV